MTEDVSPDEGRLISIKQSAETPPLLSSHERIQVSLAIENSPILQ